MPVQPVTRESVIEVLQLLVSTPSVNPILAPEEGQNETRIAQVSAQWLAEHGVKAWVDEVEPGRCNAIGQVGTNRPVLVLCGHIDTVSTAGMTIPPFEPRIEGNRLYGRGAFDMKGGVAAIACALAALAREPVSGTVMAALVCDEEYASKGADDFVKRYTADACILTEPALGGPGALVLAHKGFVWAELVTRGFATHGSRWDLGVSAIGRMGRIVNALEQFDRDVLRRREHPLVGPASLHCATIAGGTGWSTYAAECRVQVERRTIPGETPEQVLRELGEVVRAAGETADVRLVFERPPMTCPPTAPLAGCARRALEKATGKAPRDTGVAYWMDAAIFDQAGVPAVNFGSDGAGAHEAVEWVDIDTVVQVANALVFAARDYLQTAALPAARAPG
ncbi:MAG TPA: M20/M25/M40 family metallo-hydrolase [Longimicrobiales bacterium]|nr:M20/M25/M40 family metallo-hydrolase [Longimicrobiales bacterium]